MLLDYALPIFMDPPKQVSSDYDSLQEAESPTINNLPLGWARQPISEDLIELA